MTYTQEIQNKARELLAGGQVEVVIGYELGPRGRTRPAFVYDAQDVERLVWNQACTHNLTTYLNDHLKPKHTQKKQAANPEARRVAVVVKACDSRAINVLLAENRFERQQLHVIGVACDGILEGAGLAGNERSAQQLVTNDPPQYQVRCRHCNERTPLVYDTLVGKPESHPDTGPNPSRPDAYQRLQAMTPAERAEFWLSQFDRCIRCYACRQACPMCDCPTCLYERDDSLWVGMGIGLNEKRAFHLGRAFHLAGRCVGCNECERVCPMDIPISLLNRRLAQEVEAAFGHRAGLAPVSAPFVTVLSNPGG
jgi:formate dehydrogenase subunit beta